MNTVTYWVLAVFCWGLFGIFVETLWTMIRKFKRNALRVLRCYGFFSRQLRFFSKIMRATKRWFWGKVFVWFRWQRPRHVAFRARTKPVADPSMRRAALFSFSTETNGWTFFMFGFGMPLLIMVGEWLRERGIGVGGRMTVYALGFWVVEIICGSIIRMLGSKVPWDYSASRYSVFGGLIRLDYALPWALLGLWVEHSMSYWVYQVLVPALIQGRVSAPTQLPWW